LNLDITSELHFC